MSQLQMMTLEQVEEEALALVRQGHAGQYRLGQLYNYVVNHGLAKQGPYKDARDFFSQRVKAISQSVLTLYGSVAKRFPEPVCLRHGMYALEALLSYAKAAKVEVLPEELEVLLIEVPREDGTLEHKAFPECSVEELKLATRHKRSSGRESVPQEEAALVERVRGALHPLIEGKPIRVLARNREGQVFVDLQAIPVEQLARVARLILKQLQPARAAA